MWPLPLASKAISGLELTLLQNLAFCRCPPRNATEAVPAWETQSGLGMQWEQRIKEKKAPFLLCIGPLMKSSFQRKMQR